MAEQGGTAVVGLAVRLPGARDADAYWQNLCAGVESITALTDEELRAFGVAAQALADPYYVKAASLLDGVERFDAGFFDMTAEEARIRDPQHRLWLECCHEALEDAAYGAPSSAGRVGVFAAVGRNRYAELCVRPALAGGAADEEAVDLANDGDYLAGFTSYKLGVTGPSLTVATGGSGSLVAVHLACQALQAGECDMALAGGVAVRMPYGHGYRWADGGPWSHDGRCRPFDVDAAGTVAGSGVGVVVLKRLERALADGDNVRAVILGSATNNDGADRFEFAAPSRDGQAAAVRAATVAAGVDPATIGYVEGNGAGSALADAVEVQALLQAWGGRPDRPREGGGILGSVKANVGHCGAAAGIAGLVKAVLAVERATVPGTAGFQRLNPRLERLDPPLRVTAGTEPFPRPGEARRAAVSAFGAGGTNAHLVLEQAPAPEPVAPDPRAHLLVASAASRAALDTLRVRLADRLEHDQGADLASAAFTLRAGRAQRPYRLSVSARDATTAARRLRERALPGAPAPARRIALLLPGEGVQAWGMCRGLHEREPSFRAAFDDAARAFRDAGAIDLHDLLWGGQRQLRDTAVVQPALLAVQYATVRALESRGVDWTAALGHSYGEVVAMTVAGVLSIADAAALVTERARLMQACEPGAMLAVALPAVDLQPWLGGTLVIAAYNGPARTVVSGPDAEVGALEAALAGRGVRTRRLDTSHAFHAPAMAPAARALPDHVAGLALTAPARTVVSSLTGERLGDAEALDPGAWGAHLLRPVRWWQALQALLSDGDWLLVDVGPSQTASSLAREHPAVLAGNVPLVAIAPLSPQAGPLEQAEAFLEGIGRIWEQVGSIRLGGGDRARRMSLPPHPLEGDRHWIQPAAPAGQGPLLPTSLLPDGADPGPRPAEGPGDAAGDVEAAVADAAAAPALEPIVLGFWRDALGVQQIGPEEHLFDLGANSLTALEVVEQIQDATGIEVSLVELFEHPTARSLAALLEAARVGGTP
jgi:acyl transferase domain-containing protein